MFTEQVGLLEESRSLDQLVDALRFLLGNCTAELIHRGKLDLLGNRNEGARDAVLGLANYGNGTTDNLTLPDANGEMPNAWALDVLAGAVRFNGPVIHKVGWAKATANWTNVSPTAAWTSYVTCVLCTDHLGTEDARGRTITVYLPRTSTRDPNVRTGDVIRFKLVGTIAICDSEVFDGKIGEIRDLGLGEDPTTYPKRGWDLADGGGGTDNLSGDNSHLYGWTGAGVYTGTAGTTAIANAFTATISGDAATFTVEHEESGVGTISTVGHTHNMALLFAQFSSVSGTNAVISIQGVTSDGTATTASNTDTILKSSIADAIGNHEIDFQDVAAGLNVETPTVNRPAGKLVVRIQRVS